MTTDDVYEANWNRQADRQADKPMYGEAAPPNIKHRCRNVVHVVHFKRLDRTNISSIPFTTILNNDNKDVPNLWYSILASHSVSWYLSILIISAHCQL